MKFPRSIHSTNTPLGYIHSDLRGPSKTPNNVGARYVMSIIDEFSRRVWVYTLRNKSDALEKFKTWHTLMDDQTNNRVKILELIMGLSSAQENLINTVKARE